MRDYGHGGWVLADFCRAPQAVRARLTAAEVLALRLATGKLGGVLASAMNKGTAASLRPWATTLACLVSALVKLVDAQGGSGKGGSGKGAGAGNVYLPVGEKSRQLFEGSGGVQSRGFLSATADPWVAREVIGDSGRRGIAMLHGALSATADVGWASQFPQQCERLLPPGTVLTPLPAAAATAASGGGGKPSISSTNGVRCVDVTLVEYTQPHPYSTGFVLSAPTAELTTGLTVPGCTAATSWACSAFGLTISELAACTELLMPADAKLSTDDARLLGLLCGRAAKEACPCLEELSLRGGALTPSALQKLVEGLSGGHDGADYEGLTVDLHGALAAALQARATDASNAGEAIAALLQHAPYVAELDVGACPLGAGGVAPIARALAENATLSHLGIAAVSLGPSLDGAKRLASALKQNGDLLSLDIRHNALSAEGVRLIRSAAASRPRSAGGGREALDLRYEPQTPLPPGSMLDRTPREDEGSEDDYAA